MKGPRQRLGIAFRFVALVVRPLSFLVTRRDWRGAEHLPPAGTGAVVVSNHISHLDFMTFGHFVYDNGRAPRFLAKESVFRIPVVGRIIRACGQIPVFRESEDATLAYRAALDAIKDGEAVVIYPEGTITRDPDLWPMVGKTGAARIALVTGCDVIPVTQWGAEQLLGPYHKFPRLFPPRRVQVWAGPPVDLSDLRGRRMTTALLREATNRIMDALAADLATIRGETPPEQRFDPRTAGTPRTGDPSRAPRDSETQES